MLTNAHIPILGFAAWSGTGKTTLLRRLLPILAGRGIRVGMIKHAHHDFDVDTPGKDSYELRKAGAAQMLISSRRRWALMVERPVDREPPLDEVLLELDQELLDLILVEGFKHERFARSSSIARASAARCCIPATTPSSRSRPTRRSTSRCRCPCSI